MSRFGLSERTAIEAGIYRRASFAQIAKEIGTTARSVSEEIRRNRTLSPAAKFNGKDCRFAAECTRQCVCGDRFCRHECVFCRKIDCRTVCSGYAPFSCKRIGAPVCLQCLQASKRLLLRSRLLCCHPGTGRSHETLFRDYKPCLLFICATYSTLSAEAMHHFCVGHASRCAGSMHF